MLCLGVQLTSAADICAPIVLLLLQTVIIELAIKRRNRITDAAFDELCKFHHASRAQGPDNYYPRSLWLMKKIAGVDDVRKIQVGAWQRSRGDVLSRGCLQPNSFLVTLLPCVGTLLRWCSGDALFPDGAVSSSIKPTPCCSSTDATGSQVLLLHCPPSPTWLCRCTCV